MERMVGQPKKYSCRHCQSENQGAFSGELAMHFRGVEGLDEPIVWVFQEISICFDCGHAQLIVPEKELKVLRTGAPVEGAMVLLGKKSDPLP